MTIIDAHAHCHKDNYSDFVAELNKSALNGVNIIYVDPVYPDSQNIALIPALKKESNKKIWLTAALTEKRLSSPSELNDGRFCMLKIHPRLQKIDSSDIYRIVSALSRTNVRLPLMIDMFPYRNKDYPISNYQPLLFEKILNDFPQQQIVFAHFGGIYMREVFMMMKCYPNLWADTSLTTRYFSGSPFVDELFYFVKRLNGDRVLFGSDFPEITFEKNLQLHRDYFEKNDISAEISSKVLGENFLRLIGEM